MRKYLRYIRIVAFSFFYVFSGISLDESDIYGAANGFSAEEYYQYTTDPGSIEWPVAVARVTIAATRQAVAVTRAYTPEAGNLARAARISLAIAFNFNEHIKTNFPEEVLQKEYRIWELDNS